MFDSNTSNDAPEQSLEKAAAIPEFAWADIWPQQPSGEADSLPIFNHTPLDFRSDSSHLSVLGSQFDAHRTQENNNLTSHDSGNIGFDFFTDFEEDDLLKSDSTFNTPFPDSITDPFPIPTAYTGDQTTLVSPSLDWRINQAYSAEDFAIFYTPSPTTTCASEITSISSVPSSYISVEQPKAQNYPSPDVSKLRISASRRSRTFSPDRSKNVRCEDCNSSFTLRKDLERHKLSVHVQKRWECSIPGCRRSSEGYRRRDALLNHMKKHTGTQIERARRQDTAMSECSLDSESVVSSSTSRVSGMDSRELTPISPSEFESKPTIQTNRSSLRCAVPSCGRVFANSHDLSRHRKTVHMDKDAGEGYICPACAKPDKIWTRLDNFKKHLKEQHKFTKLDEVVQKSRVKRGGNDVVSFDVTTPDTFGQRRGTQLNSFA